MRLSVFIATSLDGFVAPPDGALAAGLFDRMIITRIPVLIGSGLPLSGPVPADIPLVHTRTTAYENDFVQSEYSLFRAG